MPRARGAGTATEPGESRAGIRHANSGDLGRAEFREIKVATFEELALDPAMVGDARTAWAAFCDSAGSAEAVGEAIYTALFESAPTLQSLFVTPRAVQALRFMAGIQEAVSLMDNPGRLKTYVETLGFQHLNMDVTLPRLVIFRDAILDLLEVELEDKFTEDARDGWIALLNYIGGAILYVKANYAGRLQMLLESWKIANRDAAQGAGAPAGKPPEGGDVAADGQGGPAAGRRGPRRQRQPQQGAGAGKGEGTARKNSGAPGQEPPRSGPSPQVVPRTFGDMFQFNATVMGFAKHAWMREVLASFGNMVENVANSARLQEECDVLALRISKRAAQAPVNLGEYKSCMLASLRQLLMKEWSTEYETAWNWFWDSVERSLRRTLDRPAAWEGSLDRFLTDLDEGRKIAIVTSTYERFFAARPEGQNYFKQSTSRLRFIAYQALRLALEVLRDPWKQVDYLSALGLQHVGYGIPTELFAPFVSACVQALGAEGTEPATLEAFRWSLTLIQKILVRTVNEGSTIVMKAINANSGEQLQKAMSCAPRGERAKWLLTVRVGTHSISPLAWAIESGSLEAADAVLRDLLTIRADRERYYYGAEELFARHPDLIAILVADAPSLLPTLLEGLVWRSREAKRGRRRANYYVKHLLLDAAGGFSDGLKHFVASNDPKIISHPVIILISDTLWSGIVRNQFITSRIWLILSLAIMMLNQAILPKLDIYERPYAQAATFGGRTMIYLFTMGRFIFFHAQGVGLAYRHGRVLRIGCVPVPAYLGDPYHAASLTLAVLLVLMAAHEPMFYCLGSDTSWPSEFCPEAARVEFRYSIFCMIAMGTHWMMLIDLAVFNTGLTAFCLVIVNVMSEIGLFLVALSFLLLTFASAISVLEHTYEDMSDVLSTFIALFSITLGLYEDDYRDFLEDPMLLVAVFFFVTASAILLLNLLIAQLNCSYVYIYQNMVGFARLKRAAVIVETLAGCPAPRWQRFVESLELDKPLEFNEGDVGLPGGIQLQEVASEHTVTRDGVQRFGGSCEPEMCWPEEAAARGEDRLGRLERLLHKTMKRVAKRRGRRAASEGSGSSGSALSGLHASEASSGSDG